MSLNHILSDSDANNNLSVKFNVVECNEIIIPNSERITYSNINLINSTNSENLGLTNLYIQKNNNIVNVYISGFTSSTLSAGGYIIIDHVFDPIYDSLNGSIFSQLVPKSRNADLPMFKAEAFIIYDNINKKLLIKNTSNNTNFPNGENVIINSLFVSWFSQ